MSKLLLGSVLVWLSAPAHAEIDTFDGDLIGLEGSPLTWICTWSQDPFPVDYAWAYGDGSPVWNDSQLSGSTATHTFADDGGYIVDCTATTPNDSESKSLYVVVENVAPTATATGPSSVIEGAVAGFSCSASDPGVNDVLTYSWDFGDGSSGTGANADHVFSAGTYTVTCIVDDGDGGVGTDTISIDIGGVGVGITSLSVPTTGDEGELLSFSAAAVDTTGGVVTLRWDFGDGSALATGPTVSHAYADDGIYVVQIAAISSSGDSASLTREAVISNVAPTVTVTGSANGVVNTPLSFDCLASDPGSADTHTFAWDLGDGALNVGASVSHSYTNPGLYSVVCTATDDDGGVGTGTLLAVVDLTDLPPSAPTISTPSDGALVDSLQPRVRIVDGVDPEGQPTQSLYELDVDPAFASGAYQAATLDTDASGSTRWTPATLTDGALYYLRVTTSDGSQWGPATLASFEVQLPAVDTGAPLDTGYLDTGTAQDGPDPVASDELKASPGGCGCVSGGPIGGGWALMMLSLLTVWRRRSLVAS